MAYAAPSTNATFVIQLTKLFQGWHNNSCLSPVKVVKLGARYCMYFKKKMRVPALNTFTFTCMKYSQVSREQLMLIRFFRQILVFWILMHHKTFLSINSTPCYHHQPTTRATKAQLVGIRFGQATISCKVVNLSIHIPSYQSYQPYKNFDRETVNSVNSKVLSSLELLVVSREQ